MVFEKSNGLHGDARSFYRSDVTKTNLDIFGSRRLEQSPTKVPALSKRSIFSIDDVFDESGA